MMRVSFKALPLPVTDREDKPEDINKLGKVITRLLRAHARALKNAGNKT